MSIFSIFNFKSKFTSVFTKENISLLFEKIKEQIARYVSESDLMGAEKKAKVDSYIQAYIKGHFVSDNTIVQFCIDKLIEYTPVITQFVYNFLKSKVDGLTLA